MRTVGWTGARGALALGAAVAALWASAAGAVNINIVSGATGADIATYLAAADGMVHAHPPPTRVTSTVGAGDALVAGLVAGLHAGLDRVATARLAMAFAAGKLGLAGANLPARETVLAIARTVRVESLDVPV